MFKSRAGNHRFWGGPNGPLPPETHGKGWGTKPPTGSRWFGEAKEKSTIPGPTLKIKKSENLGPECSEGLDLIKAFLD